uniref:tetratricopeptide repeat domain 24 isoform 7 n=1 Tax=Rattus norvegicus TaxID=10116 RepID=UPI0034E2289A
MATGWGWCSKKTPGAVSLPSVPGKLQTSWEASLEAKNSARVHSSAEDAQDRLRSLRTSSIWRPMAQRSGTSRQHSTQQ